MYEFNIMHYFLSYLVCTILCSTIFVHFQSKLYFSFTLMPGVLVT